MVWTAQARLPVISGIFVPKTVVTTGALPVRSGIRFLFATTVRNLMWSTNLNDELMKVAQASTSPVMAAERAALPPP